jgi:hypothetical protein
MSAPIFINQDAAYLHSLGATFITDGDFETGMRLQSVAANLQSFDDRLQAFATMSGDYIRGKRDMALEVYGRSNIPEPERTMPMPAARLGIGPNAVEVKYIPKGLRTLDESAPRKSKAAPKPSALAAAGITLNLNFGDKS